MDEIELLTVVQEAQQGNRQAFDRLVESFEPMVFNVVLRRLRNRAEAAEVTQDVFMQVMRKLSQLREIERFVGWLRQIAVRMAINRAVRRPQEAIQSPETMSALPAGRDCPLDSLLRTEAAHQIWGGLERLREMDRRTLLAFYFEGQSLKQMSDRFDSPIGTIKRRLHTARNRLKEELAELQTAG